MGGAGRVAWLIEDGLVTHLTRLLSAPVAPLPYASQDPELVRQAAEAQGVEENPGEGYRLSPKAYRLFQSKVLREIFSDLEASRSGRHSGPVLGEGAVESPKTR